MNDATSPQGTSFPAGEFANSASLRADDNGPTDAPARLSEPETKSTSEESTTRRRRGGRRRRRAKAGDSPPAEGAEEGQDAPESAEDASTGTSKPRRARRSRGGRGRKAGARTASEGATDEPPTDDDESGEAAGGRKTKSRRRRKATAKSEATTESEPRTRRKAASTTDEDGESAREPEGQEEADDSIGEDGRKRRRRGTRGGRRRKKAKAQPGVVEAIPGEEDELLDLAEFGGETGTRQRGGEKKAAKAAKKTTRRTKTAEEKAAEEEAARTQTILVNAKQPEEIRVAVCEDGRILDFQMVVDRYTSLVNDIYRGRVVNLEAPIGAAFIDFGQGRNGFLHASDVLSAYGESNWTLDKLLTTRVGADEYADSDTVDSTDSDKENGKRSKGRSKRTSRRSSRPKVPITELFKKGQMVAVQITKDAIGDKGPTLTTFISIPGRYLVLMPSLARTGVSRKIEDEKERRRLKRILTSMKIPEGMGVIVRTAGIGKTKTELRRDLDYLMAVWEDFGKRLVSGRNPAPLYEESSVAIRTMRDLFNAKTAKVVVDDPGVHKSMVEFAEALMPEHVGRIELHEGSRPLFHAHGIEQEFEKIFSRRIELPSGGSIVFDQTEALVAIDVNSGRTREGAGFEDIALKANLEAAPEIARQIRLRDLGGILVVDFIDMMRSSSRLAVEREFRKALVDDRARSKVGRISQFGLLEMTRQRLGPGLSKLIFDACPDCRGSGQRRTANSRAQAILRRLASALTQKGFSTVEVRAHPEVIDHLLRNCKPALDALEEGSSRELKFSKVPGQVEDSVLRYLRADGREVRPGGRRKR